MGLFIIGIVAGYIAFVIGKWRYSCVFCEMHAPFNIPSAWHNPSVKLGTLLATTVFSLVFASAIAALIATEINYLLGEFSWGVLLYARWVASRISASLQVTQGLSEMEGDNSAAATTTKPKMDRQENETLLSTIKKPKPVGIAHCGPLRQMYLGCR